MRLAKTAALLFGSAMISLVLPAVANAAQIGFSLTETNNGGIETLSTSLAGAVITGTTDNWNINVSAVGITLSTADLPQVWLERSGETGFNVLSIVSTSVLNLKSETASVGTPDNFCGTGSPLAGGVTCFVGSGGGNDYFATVVEQQATVPEPASLGLAAVGLALVAVGRRRRHAR
jgi:MYXO-CTERM domain-containing protein